MKKESVAYSEDRNTSQPKTEHEDKNEEVYYGRWSRNQRGGGSYRRGRGWRVRQNWRGRTRSYNPSKGRTNPPGHDGKPSTCHICGSINHWARDCQEKSEEQGDSTHDSYICLMSHSVLPEDALMAQTNMETPNDKPLLGETIGCMVVDTGTTSTVGGLNWFDCFVATLSDEVRQRMVITKG